MGDSNSELSGKVALVTGGTRGIGLAVARRLARAGAQVVICGTNDERLAQAVTSLQADGVSVMSVKADVADFQQVEALIDKILDKHSRIDIVVNNAGIAKDTLLLRMSSADWDDVLSVNLKGAFHITKAAAKVMLKQRSGRIVNITSVIGVIGNAGQANYAASKAGLIGFTKSVAKELASRNITVNAVAPGFIETDMTGRLSEQAKAALLEQIPLGRFGSPDDVAEVVFFLVSEASRYMTGQVVHVDGGMVM